MDKNKSSARLFSFFSHSPFILYNNINESSSINVCRLLLCSFHSNQILFDAATVRSIDSVSSKLFQFWRFNTKKRICCCLLCVHHRLLSINSMPMPSLSSQWLHLTFTSSLILPSPSLIFTSMQLQSSSAQNFCSFDSFAVALCPFINVCL